MSIERCAFEGVMKLKKLLIPRSVSNIGDFAFRGCGGLESIEVAPENTRYDSRDNCNALIDKDSNTLIRGCCNTSIPEGIEQIGDYAFDASRARS